MLYDPIVLFVVFFFKCHSLLWQYFDRKWIPYHLWTMRLINNAYQDGESSLRLSINRRRVMIDFNKMVQVILESRKLFFLLSSICCDLLCPQTESDCLQAVLRLCLRFTRNHSLALAFVSSGGVEKLLELRASQFFNELTIIVSLIVRHLLEDAPVLDHLMEKVVPDFFVSYRGPIGSPSRSALAYILDNLLIEELMPYEKECGSAVKLVIASLAASTQNEEVLSMLVTEVKLALLRALMLPHNCLYKHRRIMAIVSLVTVMKNACPWRDGNSQNRDQRGAGEHVGRANSIVKWIQKKRLLTDLANVPHYLNLSDPNTIGTMNAVLKAMEDIARFVLCPVSSSRSAAQNRTIANGSGSASRNSLDISFLENLFPIVVRPVSENRADQNNWDGNEAHPGSPDGNRPSETGNGDDSSRISLSFGRAEDMAISSQDNEDGSAMDISSQEGDILDEEVIMVEEDGQRSTSVTEGEEDDEEEEDDDVENDEDEEEEDDDDDDDEYEEEEEGENEEGNDATDQEEEESEYEDINRNLEEDLRISMQEVKFIIRYYSLYAVFQAEVVTVSQPDAITIDLVGGGGGGGEPVAVPQASTGLSRVTDPRLRAILGDVELPEGIDQNFLAELPENIREEVIADQLQILRAQQQMRQSGQRREGGAAADGNASNENALDSDISYEFLVALPPELQDEVLAQHRLSRQQARQQREAPDAPLDLAAFFDTLPRALREQVLADADDSQIALLPNHIAEEARRLRATAGNRDPYHVSMLNSLRQYGMLNRFDIGTSLILGRRSATLRTTLRRQGAVRSSGYRRTGTSIFLDSPPNDEDYTPSSPPPRLAFGIRCSPLLDKESLSCLIVLFFCHNPNLNSTRLHRLFKNLCYEPGTRDWLIRTFLSILDRTYRSAKEASVPKVDWASSMGTHIEQRSAGKRSNNVVNMNINPLFLPALCCEMIASLTTLAKIFPTAFFPGAATTTPASEGGATEEGKKPTVAHKASSSVAGPTASDNQLVTKEELEALCTTLKDNKLWELLSTCLSRLALSNDPHTVLVLQPAVEAFFILHADNKSEMSSRTESESTGMEIAQSPTPFDASTSVTELSVFANPGYQKLSADIQKFVRFAEKHRSVLNQILRQTKVPLNSGPFSVLVNYTRILDFDIKRKYFRREYVKITFSMHRWLGEDIAVRVKRDRIFQNSFRELCRLRSEQWKGRFYIMFEGEEGQDAGGLLREWFSVITREIFNPNYALFMTSPGDRVTYMINPASYVNKNHLEYFQFIGRLIAKAVFDNKYLDCYFTRAFYKHILGKPVKYTDMESEDPSFYQSLFYLLENPVSQLGYDITFSLEVEEFGVRDLRDLKENGRSTLVTDQNKQEYVNLVCQMKMTGAIRQQLNAFLKGFYEIIPKELISIFNEQELELLISGLPIIDIDDLQQNTEYHKYTKSSVQIQWFWRAVRSFDHADRAKLLQFVTGTSRVPLQGFASLQGMHGVQRFQIHRDDRSVDRLPTAHTCFNQLDLPPYESYDKLRQMLLLAIRECSEGFGFA
ncbi:WWE and DUF4414 and HECT domain containing protei n [Trichuris trichiura]|uniref:HECT-type E3 ubiquitin transferase n=1 Tax=Trichuris trichiura TaxID=36087 RepID=A0A077Z0C3_TRITR|nr:WWE and DUF4414 and HECT domain containing protei n [Trichuris trichiura]